MRATEIIRNVLDLIDQVESNQTDAPSVVVAVKSDEPVQTGVDTNRFKQIFDILSAERNQVYDNSPNEVVTGIEAVTTDAGGGVNGPKNPADIKSNSISMYPNYLHKPGN